MAHYNINSTYQAADNAANLSRRGNAPNAGAITQVMETAVLTVPVSGLAASDTLTLSLMKVKKPGMTLAPELCRVRPLGSSGSVGLTIQRVPSSGSTVDLTAAITVTNAVMTAAAPSATIMPAELSVGDTLQAAGTVSTGGATGYQFDLVFRVNGGS